MRRERTVICDLNKVVPDESALLTLANGEQIGEYLRAMISCPAGATSRAILTS